MKFPPPRLLTRCAPLALLLLGALTLPAALHAQAPTKLFVASTGNDANDGSRGSPKRNFQAAHDAVAAGGQIVVLDTAGYGALNITKSVAVTVPPGVNGFVTVSGDNSGITINAGAGDVVALRGLIVEGGGSGNSGLGISAVTVGNVSVVDCTARSFATGIGVAPTTAGKAYVHNCEVRGCANGLLINSGSQLGSVIALVTGCRLEQNQFGLNASNPNSSASVDVTLVDCALAGNTAYAVTAFATGCLVRADNCRITGNAGGVSVGNGAQVLSRGNSTVEKNTTGNGFSGPYSAK